MDEQKIDWNIFESPYFKVTDTPTDITFKDWCQITREFQGKEATGIKAMVVVENGRETRKELLSTSRRFITALRPFIEMAEKEGRKTVTVRVFKSGTGMNTQYRVKEV